MFDAEPSAGKAVTFARSLRAESRLGRNIGIITMSAGGIALLAGVLAGRMGDAQMDALTAQHRCVDNGRIRIPRRPIANELDWRWDFAAGNEGASSTIKRD